MLARAFYLMLAGALGGFLAWAVSEPFAPRDYMSPEWAKHESVFGLLAGCLIGIFVAGLSGWRQGSRVHFMRGAGVGLVAGAVAGTAGVHLGSAAMNMLADPVRTVAGVGSVAGFLGRCLGWGVFGGLIGCAVGLAEGIIGQSASRLYQGTIGGVLGGLLGGAMFEVAGTVFGSLTLTLQGATPGQVHETGMIPRAVGLVSTGAGIGLLIGIVEALGRKAWVRVIYGRNEGKEFLIDAPQTFLGRSEGAHVPIFGDANIMPMHAMIQKQGSHYQLIDGGSPLGTGLNGTRISSAPLNSGDMIQIGTINIEFRLKSGGARRPAEVLGGGGIPFGTPVHQPSPAPVSVPSSPTVQVTAVQPSMASSSHSLVALTGPLAGQRYPVLATMELGREGGSVPLSYDSMVSRKHASLSVVPGGIQLTDLGSTNGSQVNGIPTKSALLRTGDILKIGSTEFRVE